MYTSIYGYQLACVLNEIMNVELAAETEENIER
jgi:hypothetical protein